MGWLLEEFKRARLRRAKVPPHARVTWVNSCCSYGCDCGECYSRSPDDETSHHCEAT